jgi:glycosyltransferase involved in cell wall biosynthesis
VKVCISTPETKRPTGNFGTAFQWADIIATFPDHEVSVTDSFDPEADVLIAIHAMKSAPAIRGYRQARADGKVIVALAGTDIYPEPCEATLESMRIADRIILLQDRAILKVPESECRKAQTILQSADTSCFSQYAERSKNPFIVSVIGFLRDVKDPMRAAAASRLLPPESRVCIRHAGGILEDKYKKLVETETVENPRYRWLGIIDRTGIDKLLSESQLMVLSSFHEGGARVVSYSIVNHTPVLAAASDCAISLLGESYPGLYPAGDTEALAKLMNRAETDESFLNELREITKELAPKFAPALEVAAWEKLL